MTNKLPSASGNEGNAGNQKSSCGYELTVRTRYRGGNNARARSNELLAKRGSVKICSPYPPKLYAMHRSMLLQPHQFHQRLKASLVWGYLQKNLKGISQHSAVYDGVHRLYY